ncbi:MAG: cohesin domain-containing protein, partial [Planctomycetia bacterium]|nr:cohesin domain-containing protein [Planctomycetia bacterium]
MKTKKIVIGTMAAAMLSLSVCSLIPAAAAGETVLISAGKASAKAGETFEVEVTLADIPDTGIRGCSFSIEFDKSVITVDEITAGPLAENGAGTTDPSASMLPTFSSYQENDEGFASVMWSTSLEDASYWLKGEGVLCTVKGTVSSSAKDGDKSEIKIVPVKRNTNTESGVANETIDCGYLNKDGEKVSYDVETVSGLVTVGNGGSSTEVTLKGDANCDGKVSIADATAILQSIGNKDKYGLSVQ